ncbi:glucoamylase family protein [Rubrivirga sp.]|uniref:glucoamylase family protein n=1 Tax=Rubrivirga sp. TaxID=1885344 RepID=UPI003B51943C
MLRPLLFALLLAATAGAQTATPIFDEDDAGSDGYYQASDGGAVGNATLVLAGPSGTRLPVASGDAASGTDYGVLTYASGDGGNWSITVGAPGFAPLDLTEADSLVLFLNGPVGVPGVALPRLALEDADGDRTIRLSLDFGTRVGFNRNGSGFLDGSTTDLAVSVSYVGSLPADVARPGYPESIRITFADTVVTTSTPAIGFPAKPARFSVATEGGLPLAFRFVDTDDDGTLSADGDRIEVLTPDPVSGTPRPTWRVETTATATMAPGAGDVYRLAVFNSGVDDDPATWQRRALSVRDFGPLGDVDPSRIVGVVLENPASGSSERTLWVDAISARSDTGSPDGPAPPTEITADVGDRTVRLRWTPTAGANGVVVYRQAEAGGPFVRITPSVVRDDAFFDLDAPNGETVRYVLRSTVTNGLGPPILGPDSPVIEATAGGDGDPYIDETARRAFDYFWEEANPANGLVKDRSTPGSASSIAAVGFGLSAITVAIDRGWITREQGVARTLATLDFFATCPQGEASSGTCGYRGFFYHFLDMQSGRRQGTNELSTIDTALLLGGVLHAAQYYDGAGDEATIRDLADQIWRRVEWDWAANRPPLVTLGWKPEAGQGGFAICNGGLCDWNGYNEAMILYVLGLGSPTHPLAGNAWDAWTAGYAGQWQTHYGYEFLVFPPLFGHQYSHVWIDFRNIQDDYMRGRNSTYFENSRRATLAQRAYAIDNPQNYPNYGADEWGLTASDDPFGYRAHGAPPALADNGTITPTAAGGSYAFTPELSRQALRTFYARYYARLWGEYGLRDAYNIEENWFASDVLGIDQGPILLMIENARTGAIWESFMTHPDVRVGLERAGFDLAPVATEPAPVEDARLDPPAPNPAAGTVRLAYAVGESGDVRLAVYDVLGREVAVLADGPQAPGPQVAEWSAAVASGIYVVRLEAAGVVRTRTVVVAR